MDSLACLLKTREDRAAVTADVCSGWWRTSDPA